MDLQTSDNQLSTLADPTQLKRASNSAIPESLPKRPTTRSNAKSATDFLLDENRIGAEVHFPRKKRRYVVLHLSRMMNSLVQLYASMFKSRSVYFSRAQEKHNVNIAGISDYNQTMAIVYLSHWLHDTYRTIRVCLEYLDPVAFSEKYYQQLGAHSHTYDNFLAILNAHIRPTHITNSYADDMYIPLISTIDPQTYRIKFEWDKFTLNRDLFQLIHQTLDEKKLAKMTPLSSDITGRPSWLFDWDNNRRAYAWFPQEGNYTDEDIAVAYVIGDTCTPKLGHADYDDWKITDTFPNFDESNLLRYNRVTPLRWSASAMTRFGEVFEVHLPSYYERDDDTRNASNKGPLKIYSNVFEKPPSSSSSTDTEEGEIAPTDPELAIVPASPRYATRLASATQTSTKYYRVRVVDRLYYRQIIKYLDNASRFTAFKIYNNYN